jgi:hypothetical protein
VTRRPRATSQAASSRSSSSVYCQRGLMENLIKLHKAQLESDRMSCHSARSSHRRVLADACRPRRDPADQPACQLRIHDDPRAPDQDRGAGDRAYRAHPRPAADELPGGRIVPNRRTRPAAVRPVSRGACAPTSRHRGRSTLNASHSEWHHTDPAARTATARSFNRLAKMRHLMHDCG